MSRYERKLGTFIDFAEALATLSTCKRASNGAIIFPPDLSRVYAIGYNGPAAGRNNDACRNVPGDCGCAHAEANAVAKLDPQSYPAVIYCTSSPCEACANLIINCGAVVAVVYGKTYRDTTGLHVFDSVCMPVYFYEEMLKDATVLERWKAMPGHLRASLSQQRWAAIPRP